MFSVYADLPWAGHTWLVVPLAASVVKVKHLRFHPRVVRVSWVIHVRPASEKRKKRLNPEQRKKEGIKQKERRFRLWQNTLVNDSKNRGLENNLTVNDINEMFNRQNGLCYWFKVPLLPSNKSKHPQQPSLDRLDRTKGYTKNNVVLCCYSANIDRNENDQKTWEEFLKLLF